MFILYIDGSGSVKNRDERHFVLAGLAVFERQIYHLISDLDEVVDNFNLGDASQIELHGSPMYTGKSLPWRSEKDRESRNVMITDALGVLSRASRTVRAFGIAVEKRALTAADPVEYAFEEICNRFNLYLARHYRSRGGRDEDKQRGLIVMDQSQYEQPLQALAREFRVNGTRWGNLRNIAEVPLFVDSKASRLIQLADLIAFAVWRKYEYQDGRFFDPIISRFDEDGGVIHGLMHFRAKGADCYCPACMSRNLHVKEAKSVTDQKQKARKGQGEQFVEAARELGCDDDEMAFEERLKQVAKPPPDKPKTKRKKNPAK